MSKHLFYLTQLTHARVAWRSQRLSLVVKYDLKMALG